MLVPYDPRMADQPRRSRQQHKWLGPQVSAGTLGGSDRSSYRQAFRHLADVQRLALWWSAALLGLGTGIVLTFAIYLFEKAHPLRVIDNGMGVNTNNYPSTYLTALVALAGSLAATFGLAAFAAAVMTSRSKQGQD